MGHGVPTRGPAEAKAIIHGAVTSTALRRLPLLVLIPALTFHARDSRAQLLPAEPVVIGDGRLTIGGSVAATFSCAHAAPEAGGRCANDPGFFNYSDYENSLLRLMRVDVMAEVKAGPHVSFLTEVRTLNLSHPEPYALYVRVRPWRRRRFDLQAGRIPTTFGTFARRPYPADNLLVGLPLAYQYLTSLRVDALPANADELIRMRGRGWLSSFSVGDRTPAAGVPLVNGLRWDTGVQAHAATDTVDLGVSVTTGTLAHPLVRDNNAGPQVSGRAAWQPASGLILGASASRGPFAGRAAAVSAGLGPNDRSLTQTAWGTDFEYSRDHYLLRTEVIVSEWRLPSGAPPTLGRPLRARATSVEGRYKLGPGLYGAMRWDHLGFSTLRGTLGTETWEAPVTRVEAGVGYLLQRNLLLKASYQRNVRDGGRVRGLTIGATQLVYWF